VMPFIEEILNGINTIICDLQPQQVSHSLVLLVDSLSVCVHRCVHVVKLWCAWVVSVRLL
jgi:hypothetical protein